MPSTWMLMTRPITSSAAPPWSMCSGVITMTATMTACAEASARTAAGMPGWARSRAARSARDRRVARAARVLARHLAGQQQRVRPQQGDHDERRGQGRHQADEEGAGQHREARARPARSPAGPTRLGPATAPTVVAHSTSESARPLCCGRREVGRGVARGQRGRGVGPEQQRAGQQQREGAHRAADHAQAGADGAEQVAQRQPGSTTSPAHHARQQVRRAGGAEDLDGLHETGQRGVAGDALGQDRGHGDADRGPEAAEGLGADQHPDRAALDGRHLSTVPAVAVRSGLGRRLVTAAHAAVTAGPRGRRARPRRRTRPAWAARPRSSAASGVRPPSAPRTCWRAQTGAYAAPSSASMRAQNSVCLTFLLRSARVGRLTSGAACRCGDRRWSCR